MTNPTARVIIPSQVKTIAARLIFPLRAWRPTGTETVACAMWRLLERKRSAGCNAVECYHGQNSNGIGFEKREAGRSLAPQVGAALRMQMLQRFHVHFPALQGGDAFGRSPRRR